MIKLEVLNPSGSIEEAEPGRHATRLANLSGKTIGEVSNGLWEHDRTFPLIRELLRKQFPDIKFVPYTELPVGSFAIDNDKTADMMAAKGVDAVIGGNSA